MARLPLAATAVADVWAGWFGAAAVLGQAGDLPLDGPGEASGVIDFLLVHAAALCLYAAGMTLNDVCDRRRDATIHPGRPIPSGVVTTGAAALQGGLLLLAGAGLAAMIDPVRGAIGASLGVAVLAYDGLLKRWRVPGALAMGLCRYLDVQLGAGLAAGPWFAPAVAIAGYTTLVTLVSTLEEDDAASARSRLLGPAVAGLTVYVVMVAYNYPHRWMAIAFFGVLAGAVAGLGRRASRDPTTPAVQDLVLALLLGMFLMQGGALAGLGLPWHGLATAALMPSFFLIAWLLGGAPKRPGPSRSARSADKSTPRAPRTAPGARAAPPTSGDPA